MFDKIIDTLLWGAGASVSAVIVAAILDFDIEVLRDVVIGAFILGCIRGYTGNSIIELLIEI